MNRLILVALFLAACVRVPPPTPPESSVGTVYFTAERVSSNRIRLALDNGASRPIGYNLCTSVLQRRIGQDWVPVATEDACTLQIMSLNPGADATFEKQLPDTLAAGEYRYVTAVEQPFGSPAVKLATPAFSR